MPSPIIRRAANHLLRTTGFVAVVADLTSPFGVANEESNNEPLNWTRTAGDGLDCWCWPCFVRQLDHGASGHPNLFLHGPSGPALPLPCSVFRNPCAVWGLRKVPRLTPVALWRGCASVMDVVRPLCIPHLSPLNVP